MSSKDFNTFNWVTSWTWLYKVTSSLNSFLNIRLQWYILFKESSWNNCTCADTLAQLRQLSWSIRAHNIVSSTWQNTQFYQGNQQTSHKVQCFFPEKQAKARCHMICSGCLVRHFYSCKPRGRGPGLILPLSEKSAWFWGLPPMFLLSTSF